MHFHGQSELMRLFSVKLLGFMQQYLFLRRERASAELADVAESLRNLEVLWPECKTATLLAALDNALLPGL